jgi:hypothetical protein
MKCPYCNTDMDLGVIHSGRDSIKWIPKEKDKGLLLSPFIKGVIVVDLFEKIKSYYCSTSKKMVLDLKKTK